MLLLLLLLYVLQCRVLDFDVVGHPRANFCFAVTFPFHPYKDGRKGGEVSTMLSLVCGMLGDVTYAPTSVLLSHSPTTHTRMAGKARGLQSDQSWHYSSIDTIYTVHLCYFGLL